MRIISENRKNVVYRIKKDSRRTLVELTNIHSNRTYELPIPMAHSGNMNFSYSGVKTAFKYLVQELSGGEVSVQDQLDGKINLKKEIIYDLCSLFEASAIEQLKLKLRMALKKYPVKELWLGGGVIASARLRSEVRKVAKEFGVTTRYPFSKKLTTDNAAMIGVAANVRLMKIEDGELLVNLTAGIRLTYPEGKMESEDLKKLGIYFEDYDWIDRKPNLSI